MSGTLPLSLQREREMYALKARDKYHKREREREEESREDRRARARDQHAHHHRWGFSGETGVVGVAGCLSLRGRVLTGDSCCLCGPGGRASIHCMACCGGEDKGWLEA